ncbi:MAG: hypothetical protein U9O41_04495 [Candidatus Aerophobetes bacterium]|nr:hypothetical protein [Candidatus Aerophobetes bacterium]
MIPVEEMKKKRFQFLHTLYVLTGGNELKWFNMFDIGKTGNGKLNSQYYGKQKSHMGGK